LVVHAKCSFVHAATINGTDSARIHPDAVSLLNGPAAKLAMLSSRGRQLIAQLSGTNLEIENARAEPLADAWIWMRFSPLWRLICRRTSSANYGSMVAPCWQQTRAFLALVRHQINRSIVTQDDSAPKNPRVDSL
jgi:hypothetical protein